MTYSTDPDIQVFLMFYPRNFKKGYLNLIDLFFFHNECILDYMLIFTQFGSYQIDYNMDSLYVNDQNTHIFNMGY